MPLHESTVAKKLAEQGVKALRGVDEERVTRCLEDFNTSVRNPAFQRVSLGAERRSDYVKLVFSP